MSVQSSDFEKPQAVNPNDVFKPGLTPSKFKTEGKCKSKKLHSSNKNPVSDQINSANYKARCWENTESQLQELKPTVRSASVVAGSQLPYNFWHFDSHKKKYILLLPSSHDLRSPILLFFPHSHNTRPIRYPSVLEPVYTNKRLKHRGWYCVDTSHPLGWRPSSLCSLASKRVQ